MQIEQMGVDRVRPYDRNPRRNDRAVAKVAASLVEYGWRQPIVVDEQLTIIVGHTRWLAAKRLGMSMVPVHVAVGLSQEKAQAYRLADNRVGEEADWDVDKLRVELTELEASGVDLAYATGFDADELAKLMISGSEGLTDPDAAPALAAAAVSALGDVWVLGEHRLACGDYTEVGCVNAVLAGSKPHLMVTDPPYGVEYDPKWRVRAGQGSAGAATGTVLNDDQADWREAWSLFPGHVAYVWHAGTFAGAVADSLKATKFRLRAQIVWVKTRLVLSRGDYHHQHEPCFYGVRGDGPDHWQFVPEHEIGSYAVRDGKTGHWEGGRKQSTVWNIEHRRSDTGHGTQKPIECMRRPIENNSIPGDLVYEPFSGSGTTLIACEMTGRRARAIELKPLYADVAVRRWQEFTGRSACLESDGRSFDEVAGRAAGENVRQ